MSSIEYTPMSPAGPAATGRPAGILTGGLGTLGFPSPALFKKNILTDLIEEGYWVKMTGSRVTKDGWTSESDWDYVVYDPDKKLRAVYKPEDGWVLGSDAERGEFDSLKLNGVNLILVDKEEIWKKYIIATNLIKTLNSKTKGERIAVFESVFGRDKNADAVDFECPF